MRRALFLTVSAMLFGVNAAHAQSYSFTILTKVNFQGNGINNAGQVVGTVYKTGGSLVYDPSGTYSSVAPPDGSAVLAYGINSTGVITGFTSLDSLPVKTFIDNAGRFVYLNGPPGLTEGADIDDRMDVVGTGEYPFHSDSFAHRAFLYANGQFRYLAPPDADPTKTYGTAISTGGIVAGYSYQSSGAEFPWIYNGVRYTQLPKSGTDPTMPTGINQSQTIVAHVQTQNDDDRYNALYQNGVYTTLPLPPGATTANTFYTGINDSGVLVGYYYLPDSDQYFTFIARAAQ